MCFSAGTKARGQIGESVSCVLLLEKHSRQQKALPVKLPGTPVFLLGTFWDAVVLVCSKTQQKLQTTD